LVWSENHSCSFFTTTGRHDDPVAYLEIIRVGTEVVDAPRIPESNADNTFGRRGIIETENGVTFAAPTFADLLARFQAALEALPRAGTCLVDRRRRRPWPV